MDIKGVKPVASRVKQRPLGAKTKTHFSGHTASLSFRGASKSATEAPSVLTAPTPTFVGVVTPDAPMAEPAPAPAAEHQPFPLPRYQAPEHPLRVAKRRRLSRRGLILRGAALCFVLVATVGGLLAWNGYVKLHKVFHGTSVVEALAPKSVPSATLSGQNDGRINILLLGTGGPDNTDPDLTDTILLLSIDPVNDKATLLNIPSDLWVQQPAPYFARNGQLSTVYESGKYNYLGQDDSSNQDPLAIQAGLSNLDQVIEKVTGVDINYHLLVNFQGFKQAVDAVGGVTVNAPAELYDPALGWENHVSPVLATAGSQQMDGAQALLYARSRETTSKSSPVQRQLQILDALKDKVLSAGTLSNPVKLETLINSIGNNAYSDLSVKGAEQLYNLMNKIGDSNITSVNLTGPSLQLLTTKHFGRLGVAEPSAGLNNYTAIQEYIRGYMSDGYIANEDAPVTVLSTTAAGAAITGKMLQSYGYDVTATAATAHRVSQLTLVDLSGGSDPLTLHALESHYGVKPVNALPAGITLPSGGAKFVIIEP